MRTTDGAVAVASTLCQETVGIGALPSRPNDFNVTTRLPRLQSCLERLISGVTVVCVVMVEVLYWRMADTFTPITP